MMIREYKKEFTAEWVQKYSRAFIAEMVGFRDEHAHWNISVDLSQPGRIIIKAKRQLTADEAIDEALKLAAQPHYGHIEDEVAHLHEAIELLREYQK